MGWDRFNSCTTTTYCKSPGSPPGSQSRAEGVCFSSTWCSLISFLIPLSSKQYVNTILSMLPDDCLRLSNPVRSITSNQKTSQLELMTEEGKTESYDHVIMACHSDDTLRIMSEGEGITEDEKRILGGFRWNKNEVVVHSDEAVSTLVHDGHECGVSLRMRPHS